MTDANHALPTPVRGRSSNALLDVRDLIVAPPGCGHDVVRDFSLTIDRGEWVAITGENGSGKTTLALALAGLRPIRGGSMHRSKVHGTGTPPLDEIAVVLQEPESQLLQPSVVEELAFGVRNLGVEPDEIERRVRRRASDLGLLGDLERDPRTLSAGRQQVVLIAAALVQQPKLMILDEAGAHLDASNRALVIDLLRAECRHGMGLLWVTQEPEELSAAGRVVTLGAETSGMPRAVDPPRSPGSRRSPPMLSLCISSPADGSGPRIEVPAALAVEVPAAGVVSIEGPNGCGKSVLLAVAAGILQSPQVRIEWQVPPSLPPILAGQYPELQIFEERVEDEILFGASRRGVSRREAHGRAGELLATLGFSPDSFLGRRTWDLSAGEKRIVGIVGSLIAPASLWILDEPTAGLDPTTRVRLAHAIGTASSDRPFLIASQDGAWVQSLSAERVALMTCKNGLTQACKRA